MRQHPAPGHDPLETMTQEDYRHPIAPPPELVQQWLNADAEKGLFAEPLAAKAAQWGADQELLACCKWIREQGYHPSVPRGLHADRRPKPPSLKAQALQRLPLTLEETILYHDDISIIRRALEQLPDNQ